MVKEEEKAGERGAEKEENESRAGEGCVSVLLLPQVSTNSVIKPRQMYSLTVVSQMSDIRMQVAAELVPSGGPYFPDFPSL